MIETIWHVWPPSRWSKQLTRGLFKTQGRTLLFRIVFLAFVAIQLAGCASGGDMSASTSAAVADVWPQFLGGMPAGVPPRRGTPEYEAWMAERAAEAARPKSGSKTNATPAEGN